MVIYLLDKNVTKVGGLKTIIYYYFSCFYGVARLIWAGFALVQLQSDMAGLKLYESLMGPSVQDAISTWLAVDAGYQLGLSLEHLYVASPCGLGLTQYADCVLSGNIPRVNVPTESPRQKL